MHIALITDGLFPLSVGGMQKHSVWLAEFLAREGARISLIHPHTDNDLSSVFSAEALQQITSFPVAWPKSLPFPGHYVLESWQYSRAAADIITGLRDIDICYAQGFSGWYAGKLRKANKIACPLMVNFHGLEMFQPSRGLSNKLQQLVFRHFVKRAAKNADALVSLGGRLTPLLKSEIPGKAVVEIPIGIPEEWISDAPSPATNPMRFLFVGRYEWRKGIDILNEAAEKLSALTSKPFEIHFVGDIPKEAQLTGKYAVYYGPLRDEKQIRSIYSKCDALLCPSYSEGMPTVILEAMARGLAVICTDVGASACLVEKDNGILIGPGSAEKLAAAMTDMLEEPADRLQQMKQNSLKAVEAFVWPEIARRNLQIFRDLIESGR